MQYIVSEYSTQRQIMSVNATVLTVTLEKMPSECLQTVRGTESEDRVSSASVFRLSCHYRSVTQNPPIRSIFRGQNRGTSERAALYLLEYSPQEIASYIALTPYFLLHMLVLDSLTSTSWLIKTLTFLL